MTVFKQAIAICGLNQTEAANFFDVRLDTVKSWCAGRNQVPDGVWEQLSELYKQMLFRVAGYEIDSNLFPTDRCVNSIAAMTKLKVSVNLSLAGSSEDISGKTQMYERKKSNETGL